MGSDGAGLFCGILKHFLDRGLDCPKVLAATHFHQVFRTDLFDPETLSVTFLHMQVMFTTTDGELIMDSDISFTPNHSNTNSQYQEDEQEAVTVGPGEKITYLYKYVNE
jgi:DNA mismatch repair protein MSH5